MLSTYKNNMARAGQPAGMQTIDNKYDSELSMMKEVALTSTYGQAKLQAPTTSLMLLQSWYQKLTKGLLQNELFRQLDNR